jgi:hypothetical protein
MDPNRRKTEAINLRMSPAVKGLLRAAADREHRTLSNLLEVLILEHCERNDIRPLDEELVGRRAPTTASRLKRTTKPRSLKTKP